MQCLDQLSVCKDDRVGILLVYEQFGHQVSLYRDDERQLTARRDWQIRGCLEKWPPQEMASANLRPDLVLWSEAQHVVYSDVLTVSWEDVTEMTSERENNTELAVKAEELKRSARWRLAVGTNGPCCSSLCFSCSILVLCLSCVLLVSVDSSGHSRMYNLVNALNPI